MGFTRPANGRSGGRARERRAWTEYCAGRRIHGRQRGGRSSRWRQRVRRARRRSCGPPCRRRDCERARRHAGDGSGSDRSQARRIGRHAKQGPAGRKCDGRRVDGRAARRRGSARHAAVAPSCGWRRAAAADADGADLRRRRARGTPGRYSGFSRRPDRRIDVRRGDGRLRCGSTRLPDASWPSAARCAASRTKEAGGPSSRRTAMRSTRCSSRLKGPI